MTDNYNYSRNYLILGVPPGTGWKQLRQAYKKRVNAWHPDRFQQDARQKRLAEEKTKEITQAYKELAEYHRKFGVLPLPPGEEAPPTAEKAAEPGAAANTSRAGKTAGPARAEPAAETPKPGVSNRRARTLAAVALLGSVYFVWQFVPWKQQGETSPGGKHDNSPMAQQHGTETAAAGPVQEQRFTVGSSLGEVYAIQGVPTKTEKDTIAGKDIWYYGESKIYFARGKVLRWEEKPENPLRADVLSGLERINPGFFGLGSTKDEVLAVQGRPDRDAGSVWDYGLSRVFFDNGRVTGWHEAQYSPLRVRK